MQCFFRHSSIECIEGVDVIQSSPVFQSVIRFLIYICLFPRVKGDRVFILLQFNLCPRTTFAWDVLILMVFFRGIIYLLNSMK